MGDRGIGVLFPTEAKLFLFVAEKAERLQREAHYLCLYSGEAKNQRSYICTSHTSSWRMFNDLLGQPHLTSLFTRCYLSDENKGYEGYEQMRNAC
jgi:hypothetical protein